MIMAVSNSEILKMLELINSKLDSLISDASTVPPFPGVGYSFFRWLSDWLDTEHINTVSEATFKKDRGVIMNHVFSKSEFDIPLHALKLKDLQTLISSIPFSRQRQIAANLVVAALRSAYGNDLMSKDITVNFKKPVHEYTSDRSLDSHEEYRLLKALRGHHLETYIKIVLYSGLRRNEALGLMRKDIDFERDELHVERQVTLQNKLTSKLKTKGSRRIVKIFPALKAVLRQFDWCAPDTRLFDFFPRTVTKQFSAFCSGIDIHNFTIKSLRATFATRCKELGIPDVIIQSWLGHTSAKTTKKHYIKVNPEYVDIEFKKALERL